MSAALRAELTRRQRLFRDAGAADLAGYREAAGAAAPSVPTLLVVVDEYAELIEDSPDVLDLLTSVGRLGRSLGIHLILASQRLDDGRLRGLDAHLRLRICLRTLNASDSLAVIGSPAAAVLSARPGDAWVCRDGALTRVAVALAGDRAFVGATARPGRATTPVCLPALPPVVAWDGLAGLVAPQQAGAGAAVGLADRPEAGHQPALRFQLADGSDPESDHHLAIAGAPRSGRSSALATLVAALAATATPAELALHVITGAGSPLAGVGGLPHVGTVATGPELARRVVLAVGAELARREELPSPPAERLLLVIDDVAPLLADDALVAVLVRIATAGLGAGVNLAISCGRWTELRHGLREAIGTRWELRLNDPADSHLPAVARRVTSRPPGRVLLADGTWAQLAAPPRSDFVAAVARRGGPPTRPVQVLPDLVPAESLPPGANSRELAIGVGGAYADPVAVPFDAGEHLLVLGNSRSGRSGLLRALAVAATRRGARVWLADPRGSLSAAAPAASGYARTAAQLGDLFEAFATCITGDAQQPPGPGGHDVLVIDDLDLVESPSAVGGLAGLADLLPYAADRGLSVVAARRCSGSARSAFHPFSGRLLEFCENAVILSGDPTEGPVFAGVRPSRRPAGRGELVIRGERTGEVQAAWLANCAAAAGEADATRAVPGLRSVRGWL